jgi:glycosyltransferase involved in cell wall biosynthesis
MIGQAIESVLAQTYTNWELIIVDDGSTDNTSKTISTYSYNDNRIKYFYQINKGRSAARNKGIELSAGEYLCFLDDDDYYLSEFLLEFFKEIKLQKVPEAIFLCRQLEKVDSKIVIFDTNRHKYYSNLISMFVRYPTIQSLMISRKILMIEKFDEEFNIGEDFHLIIRVLLNYPSFFLNNYLCVFSYHNEGIMYNELKNKLFSNPGYNRLDMMNDIDQKYYNLLKEKKVLYDFYTKYNRIAYFYSSEYLKRCEWNKSISVINSTKWGGAIFLIIYYKMSIFIRIILFKIRKLFMLLSI